MLITIMDIPYKYNSSPLTYYNILKDSLINSIIDNTLITTIKYYSKIYNSTIFLNATFNINVDDPIILYNQTYNETLNIIDYDDLTDNSYLLYILFVALLPFFLIKIYYNWSNNINTNIDISIIDTKAIVISEDMEIIDVNVEIIDKNKRI